MNSAAQSPVTVHALAERARDAAPDVARLRNPAKKELLYAWADALEQATDALLAANAEDIAAGREAGYTDALLDRLALDHDRIHGIAQGARLVADLPDPVGEQVRGYTVDNGLRLSQIRVPLGVIGVVYEARPNVTVDAAALCLKSGNVALLRGSKSAARSNEALVDVLRGVLEQHGAPADAVQLLPCDSHQSVSDLITARGLVDVVIPRGSARLINAVVQGATVPTIETGTGNCHFYVDASADLDEAISLLLNSKTRRCSVCNATETVLLDEGLSRDDQLRVITALHDAGVTVHGDDAVCELDDQIVPATETDLAEEFLSLDIAAVRVDGVRGAIEHIRRYTSGHTEGIAARDVRVLDEFAREVDAAAVMLNASTAFTDGEQFGFGAEIGISTQKLHARGPVGLPELTSTKWVVRGEGHVRP